MSIFASSKERQFLDRITKEIINDVIQQSIVLFKINSEYMENDNIYGESSSKIFYPGTEFYALIEYMEPDIITSNVGLSQTRELIVYAQKENLKDENLFPEEGDFLYHDDQYFEITKVLDMKNFQGLPSKKITIQIEAKSADISTITVVERRS
jgi:hypothetical protein